MSYEKKTWVNNQTKLSATNLNRIENGVEEASTSAESALAAAQEASEKVETIEVTAAEAKAKAAEAYDYASATYTLVTAAEKLAEEAKSQAASAEVKAEEASADVENKQDKLISGESIKTINGEAILGKGDIKVAASLEVPYRELDTASLNDLKDEGVYKISTASDIPTNTSASGTLHVNALGDSHYEQLWYSDSNWARRINANEQPGPEPTYYTFYVNDVEYKSTVSAPLEITLEPGETYALKGDLVGHINITSSLEPAARTKIILKGVNILSDVDSGIIYSPENKALVVEIFADTSNYIDMPAGKEKDDAAAIFSNSDLTITGTGHLSLKTNLGHALKSSELIINGSPYLHIDAVHDAFHASKLLRITDGYFEIVNCNDVFSAGSANDPTKNTVELLITGGYFNIHKCTDSLFQGKSSQGNYKIVSANFLATSPDDISEMFQEEDSTNNPINCYDLCEWEGFSDAQLAEIEKRTLVMADQFGDPEVFYADSEGLRVDVEELGGVYSLNAGDEITYTVSGNITGKQFVTTSKKVNINLKGVYCSETDESGTTLFDYQNLKSRLQISFTEGYLNYIIKNTGTIFHSNSNLALKVRADDSVTPQKIAVVYLSSQNGTVMNAYAESTSEPSRCAIAGDGICYIEHSNVGVYGNNLWLGNEYGDNGEADWGKAYLALYLRDNDTDVNLLWKETDEPKKSGYIYAPWYLLGTCILGSNLVYADESKKWIEAPSGSIDSTYQNIGIVYTTADVSSFAINTNIVTYDPEFTVIDPTVFETSDSEISSEYGEWIIYAKPDNVYTKEEVDAKVKAVESQVISLTPKTATFEKDENIGNITVYRWYNSNSHEEDADATIYSEPVLARDGDFGYPSVDGTGQINFKLAFAERYDVASVNVEPAGAYKNIKLPAETGIENLYRVTKVSDDIKISLIATNYPKATYKINVPVGYDGSLPTLTVYGMSEEVGIEGKGKVLEFVDNIATDYLYNKDTGIKTLADGDTAQIHLVVKWDSYGAYQLSDPTITEGGYKNFKYDETTGEWKATKVSSAPTIEISILELK